MSPSIVNESACDVIIFVKHFTQYKLLKLYSDQAKAKIFFNVCRLFFDLSYFYFRFRLV